MAHQEIFRRTKRMLTEALMIQLDQVLIPNDELTISPQRWLTQPSVASNPLAINSTINKLQYLYAFVVANWDLTFFHPNQQKRLTLIARNRSNRHLERLPDYKRYPILITFLCELMLTDDVIMMFDSYWECSG